MKNKIFLTILILSVISLVFSSCGGGGSVIPTIPDDDVPVIESITPNFGAPGIEVTIKGRNFEGLILGPRVLFGSAWQEGIIFSEGTIESHNYTQIKVYAPPRKEGTVDVWVETDLVESNKVKFVYKGPVITDIIPTSGKSGEKVTIKGKNFGELRGFVDPYNYVKFGASLAKRISWSDTQIIVEAPSDYGTGIQDASKIAAILGFFVTGEITELLELFLPELELVELELDVGSEAWWESWFKIAAVIKLPFVGVRPKEGEMDITVTVETPAGSDGGLFTYVVPPNEVTYLEEEATLDSFRVAFEDIEWVNWSGGDCQGNNDYDYEDCVCDVDVDGKFIYGDYLEEVKFTITYQNDGSGNLDHEFGLKMPSIFVGESCTYNLNGSISSRIPCPGEFIFFHKDTATPGEVFYLTVTFDSPFAYSYSGFVQTDIHGNLIDIKPFINIYWDSDNSFKEKLLAGTGDKRVLLVPNGWQWASSDGTPLWDVYAEVIETDCYPEFTNPGTWTWIGGTP